jgi:hypothetical protein
MTVFFRMFNKNQVKSIFCLPRSYKLSDEEFAQRGNFIITTMSWCSYETKCWVQDFAAFNTRFKPKWIELYNFHLQKPLEIKKTNPIFPRLPDESEDNYYERMNIFLLNETN